MSALKVEIVTITDKPFRTWQSKSGTSARKASRAFPVFNIPSGKREVEAGAGRHIARAVKGAVCCWGREDGHRQTLRRTQWQDRTEWNHALAFPSGSQTGLCHKPFTSAITGAISQHLGTPEHPISRPMKVTRSELSGSGRPDVWPHKSLEVRAHLWLL